MLVLLVSLLLAPPDAGLPRQAAPTLTREDAELLKELAVLEKLELVKDLELFEADDDEEAETEPPSRQQNR